MNIHINFTSIKNLETRVSQLTHLLSEHIAGTPTKEYANASFLKSGEEVEVRDDQTGESTKRSWLRQSWMKKFAKDKHMSKPHQR